MEGSVIRHAMRIAEGQQLYIRPSLTFVNWLYQPFYYYVTALVVPFTGFIYSAGRIISLSATVGICGALFSIVRKLTGGSWFYGLIASAMYLACYHITGYSYDLARIDSLLVFLLVVSSVLLLHSQKPIAIMISAFVLALGFFTKQQAVLYLLPGVIWLLLTNKRSAYLYLATLVVSVIAGTLYLIHANGEWYTFYVYTVPSAKSATFGWFRLPFVLSDYVLSVFGIGMVAIAGSIALQRMNVKDFLRSNDGFIVMLLMTSVVQLAFHLGDQMSYKNVAMPLAAFFSLAFAVMIYRGTSTNASYRTLGLWIVIAQFLALLYNPNAEELVNIKQSDYESGAKFTAYFTSLPGDVLLHDHDLMPPIPGKAEHCNPLAWNDASLTHKSVSDSMKQERDIAYQQGKFDAIILDQSPFSSEDSIPGYYMAERINLDGAVFRSRVGGTTTVPRYLYLRSRASGALK